MKNAGTVSFITGYRIYEDAETATPYNSAVGETTTYTLVDHGYVNPNPTVVEPDEEEMMDSEAGAAALFSATVALFATFLMF